MSVLIKGMEMPKNCDECKIKSWDEGENDYVCPFSGFMTLSIGRQDDCPLEEQEPCEDAVSREAVYEAMVEKGQHSRRYKVGEIWELNGDEIREALDMVPSVSPKPDKDALDNAYNHGYAAAVGIVLNAANGL